MLLEYCETIETLQNLQVTLKYNQEICLAIDDKLSAQNHCED